MVVKYFSVLKKTHLITHIGKSTMVNKNLSLYFFLCAFLKVSVLSVSLNMEILWICCYIIMLALFNASFFFFVLLLLIVCALLQIRHSSWSCLFYASKGVLLSEMYCESTDGPFYTHLGTANSVLGIRKLMEAR